MNISTFSHELSELCSSYRLGRLPLSEWSQRAEYLVDAGRGLLPRDRADSLQNWIYLVEDVVALSLDEGRALNETEVDQVLKAMMAIDHLVLPYLG